MAELVVKSDSQVSPTNLSTECAFPHTICCAREQACLSLFHFRKDFALGQTGWEVPISSFLS